MILTEKQLATQEVIIKKLYPGVSIEKAKEEIVGNSKPIRVWFEERIDGFCVERYGKHCEKFSTYTDGEIYGIIGPVQIPYSTIVCFETYRLQISHTDNIF